MSDNRNDSSTVTQLSTPKSSASQPAISVSQRKPKKRNVTILQFNDDRSDFTVRPSQRPNPQASVTTKPVGTSRIDVAAFYVESSSAQRADSLSPITDTQKNIERGNEVNSNRAIHGDPRAPVAAMVLKAEAAPERMEAEDDSVCGSEPNRLTIDEGMDVTGFDYLGPIVPDSRRSSVSQSVEGCPVSSGYKSPGSSGMISKGSCAEEARWVVIVEKPEDHPESLEENPLLKGEIERIYCWRKLPDQPREYLVKMCDSEDLIIVPVEFFTWKVSHKQRLLDFYISQADRTKLEGTLT